MQEKALLRPSVSIYYIISSCPLIVVNMRHPRESAEQASRPK